MKAGPTIALVLLVSAGTMVGCSKSADREPNAVPGDTGQAVVDEASVAQSESPCPTILRFVVDQPGMAKYGSFSLNVRVDWAGHSRTVPVTISPPETDVCLDESIPYRVRIHFYNDKDEPIVGRFTRGGWVFRGRRERERTETGADVYILPLSGFREPKSFHMVPP
jgi:hypothetical protein